MRAILFDKDGTLLDFHGSWSPLYRELCLELCEGEANAARAMLTSGGMDPDTGIVAAGSVLAAGNTRDIVQCWYPDLDEADFRSMMARIDTAFFRNGVLHSVLVPQAAATLATLAEAGYALGVATSDGTAGTRAALAALGLESRLPHVYGYDSVANPKPAPDIVHAFAAAIGFKPGDIVVVGDNTHDLQMARAAGAGAGIGVLTGTGAAADLLPLADAVLDSVCDLPDWLAARP